MNYNIGIYKITSPSNKVYIGQSRDIEKRHTPYKNLNCKSQTKLYNSLKYHGWENHVVEIILYLDKTTNQEIMDYWEMFFITHYKNEGFELLNIKLGGSGGGKHDEESKKKMSIAQTGKKQTPEQIEKRTAKLRGRKQRPEVIKARSEYMTGKKLSEKHCQAIGKSKAGVKQSQETIIKRGIKTATHSRISVVQLSLDSKFIKQWDSMFNASEALNIGFKGISRCCSGKRTKYKDFIWKKTTEYQC